MQASKQGELLQIDHMTISIAGIGQVKQFNEICHVTRIVVERIYKEANARNAANFLEYIIQKLPFPIVSILVDGCSEFMKGFELLCKKFNLPLLCFPLNLPNVMLM